MKYFAIFLFFVTFSCFAQEFKIDDAHSSITFSIQHNLISEVDGAFNKFEGEFNFDEKNPSASNVNAKIKVDSINTSNAKRDGHLKGEDFFDEKKYPDITFTSTKVTPNGDKNFTVAGNLTMHGVTKPVSLDVTYNGIADDMTGAKRSGFKATTKIKRNDFGIVWNKTLDKGGLVLGDDVAINIKVEGVAKEKPSTKKKH